MKIIERGDNLFVRHWFRWYKMTKTTEHYPIIINKKTIVKAKR